MNNGERRKSLTNQMPLRARYTRLVYQYKNRIFFCDHRVDSLPGRIRSKQNVASRSYKNQIVSTVYRRAG